MDDPEQEAKEADDEQVLVIKGSSYPLSRFSANYLSHIIKKDVPDKRIFLRSLPIPPIEVLYHELGFGKERALDGTLSSHVHRSAFRMVLQIFRKDRFTGDSQVPTQIADWHSPTCFSKFEGLASEFLDRYGIQFWGNGDSKEVRNGMTMAKHQDLIHFLIAQILFRSVVTGKTYRKSSVTTCNPATNPGLPESNLSTSQEMVLSPRKLTQRPSGDVFGASKVQEGSQPAPQDTTLAISPRKPSTVAASANPSPLARKRPRPSSTEDRPDDHRPRAAFWYRVVYSRSPYSVEIWKPRKSLHDMSLSELKADLPSEVGSSTRKLVLHLTGPDLCLKSRLDLTDEEAFAYVKGQMRMLVEPIVAQYQQKNKNAVFDVEIEVMSDE
ncbi:unnamed protein product [Clonostachys rhizophaga]|uniref:Uncharacterized protein n=1 Tax=Clonostachys rhizophaga TaxID=160324 RepID=A0A9N9YHC5_9HYPO|nr:unnamed protein product [Clonostachys rhizophaga]